MVLNKFLCRYQLRKPDSSSFVRSRLTGWFDVYSVYVASTRDQLRLRWRRIPDNLRSTLKSTLTPNVYNVLDP